MSINYDYSKEIYKTSGITTGSANFYAFSANSLKSLQDGIDAIPPLNAVIAAYYYPYLNYNKLTIEELDLKGTTEIGSFSDLWTAVSKYHLKSAFITGGASLTAEVLYDMYTNKTQLTLAPNKITGPIASDEKNKILLTFSGMPTKPSTVGGNFNWKNESKCFIYPYRYIEFNDGLSEPYILEPQYLKVTGNELHVRQSLSLTGEYDFYVKDYKGDKDGLIYNQTNAGLSVAVTNDPYLNYLNEHKLTRLTNYANQAISIAGAVASGNVLLGVSGATNALGTIAQEQDLKTVPRTINIGGDYITGLNRQTRLEKFTHRFNDSDMNRLAMMFHMYGYKQDKLIVPDLYSRKYWNYLKCSKCNIKSKNGSVPKEHLKELKSIFENGTTLWHINNGAVVGDYHLDNPEV